jgi:(R,R)-butanediol dehydrogenase / meso-butanediol dehydrogenase / diacetyl reductase
VKAGVDTVSVDAFLVGQGAVQSRSFQAGPPRPGQVGVEILLCGVCVAEVKAFKDGSGHGPSLCGHEWVGRVRQVGDGVTSVAVGDRVVVAVPDPCDECPPCSAGRPEFCSFVMSVARGRDEHAPPHGGFARSLTVAEYRVLPVGDQISDTEAAFVEPAAIAYHAVARANVAPGDTVAVLGAGPIGLLCASVAKVAGAEHVVVIEPSGVRREAARACAADAAVPDDDEAGAVINELSGGRGASVVLECVGAGDSVQQAVDLVRQGGRVVLLGDASVTTISPKLWLAKEVTVVASAGYSRGDIRQVVELMAAGRLAIGPLHTRTIGLGGLAEVLGDLAGDGSREIKVLVDPRRPD